MMYAKRNEHKRLMKIEKDQSEKHDALQTIAKLFMNSTYGKLAWSESHDASGMITADHNLILKLFSEGNLRAVENINDQYCSWSGT